LTLGVWTYRLDDFSRVVAEQLFERFPQWRELASIQEGDDGATYLRVSVPAPEAASASQGLSIVTPDHEVIVGFDYSHVHCLEHTGDGEHFGAAYALHFISQLVSEEVAVASWWLRYELVAFSAIENGKAWMGDDLVGPYDRMRIRSWKGSLNADKYA
jgi:hypothetical protein